MFAVMGFNKLTKAIPNHKSFATDPIGVVIAGGPARRVTDGVGGGRGRGGARQEEKCTHGHWSAGSHVGPWEREREREREFWQHLTEQKREEEEFI